MQGKRNSTMDIVKAIGIISIVMGHCLLFNHDTSLERQCGRICIQLSFNGVLFFVAGFFLQKRIP